MADEKKAVVWSTYEYKGFKVSFTVRDDFLTGAMDIMEAQIDSLLERGERPWLDRLNVAEVGTQNYPTEEQPPLEKDKVMGDYLGLLKYAPKASEFKSGQTYELKINAYKLKAHSHGPS